MDVSLYDGVTALHVAAAVAWIGTVAVLELLGLRVRARGDAHAAVAFAADRGWVGRVLALPGALVLLISGGWLAQDGDVELDQAWWLGSGIGLWLVAFLGSAMLRGPEARRIVALAAQLGADAEEVRWRVWRVTLLQRGELLLLVVALMLMVLQPS